MKFPESVIKEKQKENREKNDKENENQDINDIRLFRKKQKKQKRLKRLIILLAVLIAGVLVWAYRDVIFEPLRGIAARPENTETDEAGFPISMPASSGYSFMPLEDSFALVTDTYIYNYGISGRQNFAIQHGYVKPMAAANKKRVLIYDKGGHDFALYSKSNELFRRSIENEVILSGFIGEGERIAVVTSGGQYSSVVYVYDGSGAWLYTRKYVDDNVMQAAFSPDNRYIYIARARSENAGIVTVISKYDMSNEGEELWSSTMTDCVSVSLTADEKKVTAVCDNKLCVFDSKSGEENGTFAYSAELVGFNVCGDGTVVVHNDYSGSKKTISLLDGSCVPLYTAAAPDSIYSVFSDGNIYVLASRRLDIYDGKLELIKSRPLDDEYTDVAVIGGSAVLLCYDSIECIDIG